MCIPLYNVNVRIVSSVTVGKYQDLPMTSSSHDSTMSSLDSSYLSSGHESSTSADISPVKIPYRSPQHYPVGAYKYSASKMR